MVRPDTAQAAQMLHMRTLYLVGSGNGEDTAQATPMLRMRTLYLVGSGNGEAGHCSGRPNAVYAHSVPGGEWDW